MLLMAPSEPMQGQAQGVVSGQTISARCAYRGACAQGEEAASQELSAQLAAAQEESARAQAMERRVKEEVERLTGALEAADRDKGALQVHVSKLEADAAADKQRLDQGAREKDAELQALKTAHEGRELQRAEELQNLRAKVEEMAGKMHELQERDGEKEGAMQRMEEQVSGQCREMEALQEKLDASQKRVAWLEGQLASEVRALLSRISQPCAFVWSRLCARAGPAGSLQVLRRPQPNRRTLYGTHCSG